MLTTALSSFSDIELIEKIKFYIFEHIPPRSRGQAIGVLRNNPVALEHANLWQYYIANLDNFEKLSPFMYQAVLTGLLPELTKDEEDIKQFFEGYLKKKPMLQDAIDVALESMEINKQIKSFLN